NLFIIIYNIYISIVCTYLLWSSYILLINCRLNNLKNQLATKIVCIILYLRSINSINKLISFN
ncbi:MAG: hypothetical protein O7C56_06035, partial [Rickettsia endosymbiont of Ixodes persulcatus]|nr:hypothetical protein [Rickettsia endosymbiont of Ixodes persulcatus]